MSQRSKTGRPRGRPSLYPWSRWFDPKRPATVLWEGSDYACSTLSMASQVRMAASRRGIPISITETRSHDGTRTGLLLEIRQSA